MFHENFEEKLSTEHYLFDLSYQLIEKKKIIIQI